MIAFVRELPYDERKAVAVYRATSLGHLPGRWRLLKRQTAIAHCPQCGGTVVVTGPHSGSPEDEPVAGRLVGSMCPRVAPTERADWRSMPGAARSRVGGSVHRSVDQRSVDQPNGPDDEVLLRQSGFALFE